MSRIGREEGIAVWQDSAFSEWRAKLEAHCPSAILDLIEDLPRQDQVFWLRCCEREAHPVALGMARWLSRMDSRLWAVVPGDGWAMVESDDVVLAVYPEFLGWDPLAMCALSALWAGNNEDRWNTVASLLGPVAALGALEGQLDSEGLKARWESFKGVYGSFLEEWYLEAFSGSDPQLAAPWSQVPDYAEYREQLEYGVVPHEVGGQGIVDETAVLLALYQMPDSTRPMMAGLAYKALEGLWMMNAWRRVR